MWITKLLGNSTEVSHKRLISLLSFIVLIGILVLNAYGVTINDNILYVFFALTIGNTTLTMVDKSLNKEEIKE